jgi:hypothetical protein
LRPLRAPTTTRLATQEFVTRANYGLVIGNFEMDLDDGEVRFKASLDLHGEPLTTPLLRALAEATLTTMRRYLPGLLAVMHGVDPRTALAGVESTIDAPELA